MAAAQPQAIKDQIWQKASEVDLTAHLDVRREVVAYRPDSGAKTQKFRPECGARMS